MTTPELEQIQIATLRLHNQGKKRHGQHQRRCRWCKMLQLIDQGMPYETALESVRHPVISSP